MHPSRRWSPSSLTINFKLPLREARIIPLMISSTRLRGPNAISRPRLTTLPRTHANPSPYLPKTRRLPSTEGGREHLLSGTTC